MADLYGLEASGLPEELVARLTGASKREKIAEALLAQAMGGIENAGGPGAPLHWTQGAAQMLKAYLGNQGVKGAQREREAVAGDAATGRQSAIEAYMRQKMGAPGVTPLTPNDDEGNAMPSSPAVAGDRGGAIANAVANKYLANSPFLKMEQASFEAEKKREDEQTFRNEQARVAAAERAANLAQTLEQRKFEIERRLEDRALDRSSREMLMRSQQEITREIGMARAEAAMAAADARGDARAATASAKEEKANEAKRGVSTLIGELSGYFDNLDKMGAAINTDKPGVKNLAASVRASAPGQLLGGTFGTGEQKVRDEIKQMSPMLLNAIRQATQQGARGLDSNAELKFYLQAVTDPTKSLQYNRTAMRVLEKAYGLGAGVKGVSDAEEKALKDEFAKSQPQNAATGQVLRFDANGNPM